jgi:arabinogalactan endo-1,4-beta-galactosidase
LFARTIWLLIILASAAPRIAHGETPWVRVADGNRGFVLSPADRPFLPWGLNYDHDENGRLLEDYWDKQWPKVEVDFREMKQLGANVVRIHLQLGCFMDAPEKPNQANFARLGRLVAMAEKTGLYLDITGLGCYRKRDVPPWYDQLGERQRWDVQAQFWESVAQRCGKSPAVFCYDLMNEPIAPAGDRKPGDWLGPPFLGCDSGYFVQLITLRQEERPRPTIARQWCHRLVTAIRKHDQRHMVTVGLVPWSLDRPGITSGFVPKEIAPELDFIAVHLYPQTGKRIEDLKTLQGFAVGKPVVVEEMFPLNCTAAELGSFIDQSQSVASGWIGFYWGKTLAQYRQSGTAQDAVTLGWLELFQRRAQAAARLPFILGADLSWVQEQEDQGVRFTDRGEQKEILAILKDRGFNWIRLRVFNDPKAKNGYSSKGYCNLAHTLTMAKRIRAAGMRFLLDFHYSDTWADPAHQFKPAAWADLRGASLEKAVHDHTRDVVAALKKQGTPPDMVQVGNEISNGFLWPDGDVWKSGKWDVFCGLVKAGIAGAKQAEPSVQIMLHLACGGQNAQSRAFLDKIVAQRIAFDIIGQSYYSKWHGPLNDLKSNLADLASRYAQEIIVVEYSVPNVRQINDIVHGLPEGKGLGTFIWEPTKWEGPALFDGKGNTKPEIDAYSHMAEEYGKRKN